MTIPLLIAGLRTPFARSFKGSYADVRPDDLMVELIQGHQSKFSQAWESPADELILGCAYPEGEQGYNLGRTVSLGSGINLPALTINRLCASSLDAAGLAAAKIRGGQASKIIVAGVESMSRVPRRGANFSESDRIKQTSPQAYITNGTTAENVANLFPHITRVQQEAFSAASHQLADQAYRQGQYRESIFPYLIEKDQFIRVPVDREKMASLAPAFQENGSVTAATSSPLTDGATMAMIVNQEEWQTSGLPFALELVDYTVGHVPPELMGMGPVPATEKILDRNQLNVADIVAWEINEAFAIQVLACADQLKIDIDRINRWGGALALGHPLGASGLRLLITLLHRLATEHQPGDLGMATLCVGGGQGVSILAKLKAQ